MRNLNWLLECKFTVLTFPLTMSTSHVAGQHEDINLVAQVQFADPTSVERAQSYDTRMVLNCLLLRLIGGDVQYIFDSFYLLIIILLTFLQLVFD